MNGGTVKELNKELETMLNRFRQMKDIDYDHNKIDYLYMMSERAMESGDQVRLIIERLKAVE